MLKSFLKDTAANFALTMGVLTIPLVLSVGFAVDYTRYISADSHLQELADAASLALAASREQDKAKLNEAARHFISANMGVSKFTTVDIVDLDTSNNKIDLDLKSNIKTYFMGLANIDRLDVRASALAERAVVGSVEVALVLDNTLSMSYDNKIGILKEAAGDLVGKLFDEDKADIRIGLVPYAEQINVGKHNRSASWLSVPNDYSTTKTTTKDGYWHQPMKNTSECQTWKEAGSRQVEKDGVLVTESWPRSCSKWKQVENGPKVWIEPKTTTTVTNYKWHGCIGSRIYKGKLVLDDQSPSVKYPGFVTKNKTCLTEVLPLTADEDTVQNAITAMSTAYDTYIPAGVIWGLNVLSSTEPMTEGAAYDPLNKKPRKVMVLMTDGLNTKRVKMSNGDYHAASDVGQRRQVNEDTETVCTFAKAQNIEIFSVAFKVDDADAKAMLQDCATDSDHYYDASDSEKLLAAFSGIAQSLSQVRLAR